MAVLALGLTLFAAGLRAFHAHPIPTDRHDKAVVMTAVPAHVKACSLGIAPVPPAVLDPRVPRVAPPDEIAGRLASSTAAIAEHRAIAGRLSRAPPTA